jgi:heterotetrameric sarcosine oxidase delta subunit
MSFLLSCPTCGPRPVDEFSWGGEFTERPARGCDDRELFRTLYTKRNVAGVQDEWWFHGAGCREWFTALRDTRTNEVLSTARPARRTAAVHG